MWKSSGLLVAVVVMLWGAQATAEEAVSMEGPGPTPTWDLAAEGQLAFSVQRLGMLADLKLRAKRRLYESESELFHDNAVTLGLTTQLAPVFAHAGVQVDLQPASFLKLSSGYQFVGYFGSMGSVRSPTSCSGVTGLPAADARCDFHPLSLDENPRGDTATGHRVWLEAQLMGRVGPVIALGGARLERWLMDTPGEYWLNELYGVPQSRNDTMVTGGGALLYAVLDAAGRRPELLVGAADELAWSLGTDGFYNRVGPVAMLRVPRWGPLREVTAQAAVLFYTHERYLTGQPYVAVAISAATPNFLASRRVTP